MKKNKLLDKYKIKVYDLMTKYENCLFFIEALEKDKYISKVLEKTYNKEVLKKGLEYTESDIAKINLELEKIRKELLK